MILVPNRLKPNPFLKECIHRYGQLARARNDTMKNPSTDRIDGRHHVRTSSCVVHDDVQYGLASLCPAEQKLSRDGLTTVHGARGGAVVYRVACIPVLNVVSW
jgi:hypothetical protein